MKEESNCFGLIIWIRAARGYTHLLRALSGWWDGEEREMQKRRLVSRKDLLASTSLQEQLFELTRTSSMSKRQGSKSELKSCLLWYFHLYSSRESWLRESFPAIPCFTFTRAHTFTPGSCPGQPHASTGVH